MTLAAIRSACRLSLLTFLLTPVLSHRSIFIVTFPCHQTKASPSSNPTKRKRGRPTKLSKKDSLTPLQPVASGSGLTRSKFSSTVETPVFVTDRSTRNSNADAIFDVKAYLDEWPQGTTAVPAHLKHLLIDPRLEEEPREGGEEEERGGAVPKRKKGRKRTVPETSTTTLVGTVDGKQTPSKKRKHGKHSGRGIMLSKEFVEDSSADESGGGDESQEVAPSRGVGAQTGSPVSLQSVHCADEDGFRDDLTEEMDEMDEMESTLDCMNDNAARSSGKGPDLRNRAAVLQLPSPISDTKESPDNLLDRLLPRHHSSRFPLSYVPSGLLNLLTTAALSPLLKTAPIFPSSVDDAEYRSTTEFDATTAAFL